MPGNKKVNNKESWDLQQIGEAYPNLLKYN